MSNGDESKPKLKVALVGVGGATCSGKTTLAKYLKQCLPDSFIIHQDDFAPPQDTLPIHPVSKIQDWDDAPGAIDWPRLRDFLRIVKQSGEIPSWHKSHDHLNEQKEVPLDSEAVRRWRQRFEDLRKELEEDGVRIVWGLVDGFLLYWDREIVDSLDARIFLRVSHDVLRRRRHERHGYHTAENTLWRDPPEYFEQVVYPAYVRAHEHMLSDGDVEKGTPNRVVEGLVLIEGEELGMEDIFERSCEAVEKVSVPVQS